MNPITSDSQIKFTNPSNEKLYIKVVNVNEIAVLDDWFCSDLHAIGKKINQPGIYLYIINNDKKTLLTGKFIKE